MKIVLFGMEMIIVITKVSIMEIFLLKNLQVQNKDYTRNPEDKYRKISGYSRLQAADKTIFQKVFDIREKYAEQYDLPPHSVIRKTDLLSIVKISGYIDKIHFSKKIKRRWKRINRKKI